MASVAGGDDHDTGTLRPGPGGGSESDHDRSSDRSDDLSSRESSSADQVHSVNTLTLKSANILSCYRRTEMVSRAVISVIK